MTLEDSLIFYPGQSTERDRGGVSLGFEDAYFHAADGVKLHGWFAEARNPCAIVLYAHGNAGSVSDWRWVLRLFRERLNASILVFDYRGYGKSEGTPHEAGVLEDARAARKWLAHRTGVDETEIVLVGRSLGGAVAVDLAATDGARGLVLENTFTSLPDVAASHFPLLPVRWLMRSRLDSLAKISAYHGPLLQTHGDADRVVPLEQGERLHQAASGPKQFVVVAGGGHNDPPTAEYMQALERFLSSLPRSE